MILHHYQTKAVESQARFLYLIAGKQSGKTLGAAATTIRRIDLDYQNWIQQGAIKELKPEWLIAAPTETILYSSTIKKFIQSLPEGIESRLVEKQRFLQLSNGIKIRLASTHNANSIEAMTLSGAWLDESGQMSEDSIDRVKDRVTIKRGWVIHSTTPYEYNWLYRDVYRPFVELGKVPKDTEIIIWTSADNPYFSKKEFAKRKRELSEEEFALKYLGRYVRPSNLVFLYDDEDVIRETKLVPVKYEQITIGVDFGMNKPCGILVIGFEKGNFWIISEFKQTQVPVTVDTDSPILSMEEILKDMNAKYDPDGIYADQEDPKSIRDLRDKGLSVMYANKGRNAKRESIWFVQSLLKQKRFFISTECPMFLAEFKNLIHKMGYDGLPTDEVVKKDDHLIDAMLYAIFTHNYDFRNDANKEIPVVDSGEVMKIYTTPALLDKYVFNDGDFNPNPVDPYLKWLYSN